MCSHEPADVLLLPLTTLNAVIMCFPIQASVQVKPKPSCTSLIELNGSIMPLHCPSIRVIFALLHVLVRGITNRKLGLLLVEPHTMLSESCLCLVK
jgi:hypothetical protein